MSTKPLKKPWLLSILGLVTAISVLFTAVRTEALLFVGDFDRGDLLGWEQELCCKHSAQIVNTPTRTGKYAVKFTLNKGDPDVANKPRAELKLDPVPADVERWYGFSNYLSKDWMNDPSFEITAQFHNRPDLILGEDWRSPGLTLSVYEDRWRVSNRWDPKQVSQKKDFSPEGGSEGWDLGGIEKGKWTDWVFHVKWSHKLDGLLEVWKNGKLIVQKTGPNTYNDVTGPFLKIGLYKPEWKAKPELSKTTQRVIYFDEVRIGNASASYKDIVPRS